MTTEERKIIDRIRKVLAKAEGTNNIAEAEMLMAKVAAMLEEHNLELLDIGTADADDPIGTTKEVATHLVNDSWMRNMVSALARYYGCRLVYTGLTKNKTALHVSGRESARITTQLMVPFVRKQVLAKARELVNEQPENYRNNRVAARRVANALTMRVNALAREQQEKEEQRVASGERALVPVDMIEAEMERAFGPLGTSRKTKIITSRGAMEKAAGISLSRQMSGSGTKMLTS